MTKYDVVISGAGIVGLTLSALLAKRCPKLRILLLDKSNVVSKFADLIPLSAQCIAYNRASKSIFESLGIWSELKRHRVQPVKSMKIWDACLSSMVVIDQNKSSRIAHIIQNDITSAVLYNHVHSLQVERQFGKHIYEVDKSESQYIQAKLTDGETTEKITCKLLINAEGWKSSLRSLLGFKTGQLSYDCWASVAVMKKDAETDPYAAYQRFIPTGPIASLPLSDEECCVIWFVPEKDTFYLKSCSDAELISRINKAFSQNHDQNSTKLDTALSKVFDILQPSMKEFISNKSNFEPPSYIEVLRQTQRFFPVVTCLPTRLVQPRVVLIGDSAHRMHPLAGQGANVGMEDVSALVDIIEEQLETGGDIGDLRALLKYERIRQPISTGKTLLMDGFYRVFGTSFWPIVLLRSIGLNVFDRVRIFKKLAIYIGNKG